METPGLNPASELSLLKVCFCIQQCWPCFSHKTSKNWGCRLCVSPRFLCTYGQGNARSYFREVRHDKGKSESSVCRSFHESGWRIILWNIPFKRNLQQIEIVNGNYCVQWVLVMQMNAESRPLRFTLLPAPVPVKPASCPFFPGPWLHVFSSSTLWVWFLLNKAFLDG